MQIPPPKPPPPEMHFIPNPANSEFVCLLGLEECVSKILHEDDKENTADKPFPAQNASSDTNKDDTSELDEKLPIAPNNIVTITETVETSVQPLDALHTDTPSSLVTTTLVTSICSTIAGTIDDGKCEKRGKM